MSGTCDVSSKSSCKIPLLGLGTFKITGVELIRTVVDNALEAGYRLIDTASVYRNESDIGAVIPELLAKHSLQRSDLFVTSKLAPRDHGIEKCRDACLASLNRLGLDYLDLYLIHWPGVQGLKPDNAEQFTLRQQSWHSLEQLYDEGKIKAIGVSNYTERHLRELLQYCRIKPTVLQIEYHPHLVQKDLRQLCLDNDIFLQAYSSLGTSGTDNKLLHDAEVIRIAEECERTSAEILLRWAVQQNIGVIPKSTSAEHIRLNARIFDFQLSDQHMSALDELNCTKHYCWDPTSIC